MTYSNLMTTKRAMYASASLWFLSVLLACLRVAWESVLSIFVGVCITICFVLSSASYIKIYFIVRHHQIQIHAHQQAVNSFNISVNIPDSSNMIISKKHALKTIYFICMICCYFPYLFLFISTNHLSYRLWEKLVLCRDCCVPELVRKSIFVLLV